MNEYKTKLLDYISKNYDNVVKQSRNGEYIEIDLIPGSHGGLHELTEILEYCEKIIWMYICLHIAIQLVLVMVLE